MSVRVNKSSFNIREKLSELERPIGLKGSELMRAETAQEARDFVSAGRKNRVINGDMRINQRGGTISVDTSGAHNYSIDRFAGIRGSSGVAFTLQQSSDAPPEFKNSLLITVPTGAVPSSTQVSTVVHCIEGFNTDDLSWGTSSAKTITASFWVKSNVTGIFPFIISNNGRTRAYGATYSINTASTWEYKTITIPGDVTGTWDTATNTGIHMYWGLGAAGSARTVSLGWSNTSSPGSSLGTISGTTHLVATTGATLQLTGVQLEVGKNATEFEHRSYGEELALCQRYYYRVGAVPSADRVLAYSGQWFTSTSGWVINIFPVTMRVRPTALETTGSNSNYNMISPSGGPVGTNAVPTWSVYTTEYQAVTNFTTASGGSAGGATYMYSATSGAYLGWSAEL